MGPLYVGVCDIASHTIAKGSYQGFDFRPAPFGEKLDGTVWKVPDLAGNSREAAGGVGGGKPESNTLDCAGEDYPGSVYCRHAEFSRRGY